MAEAVGFEPTRPAQSGGFKDRCIRPLCHASKGTHQGPFLFPRLKPVQKRAFLLSRPASVSSWMPGLRLFSWHCPPEDSPKSMLGAELGEVNSPGRR